MTVDSTWAYALVPPVPSDLPALLVAPLPVPFAVPRLMISIPRPRVQVSRPRVPRPRIPVQPLIGDAAGQARRWFSAGGSVALIVERLNQNYPRQPRWTRPAVRALLMQTKRAKLAA